MQTVDPGCNKAVQDEAEFKTKTYDINLIILSKYIEYIYNKVKCGGIIMIYCVSPK